MRTRTYAAGAAIRRSAGRPAAEGPLAPFADLRYDVVCPMRSAWDLHRTWPEAKLVVVPDAGHSMHEAGIQRALIRETGRFAKH